MADKVTITHPKLKDTEGAPLTSQVSRDAFEGAWKSRDWKLAEPDKTGGSAPAAAVDAPAPTPAPQPAGSDRK